MVYKRVERQDLTTPVARQIRTSILDGTYQPGDFLPPERALAVQFGVDRNTLRSAIQAIEQLGLVERRQGSGCKVLDYRETGTLDLLQYLVFDPATNELDTEILASALDMSALTFHGIIARVVVRAEPEDFESMREALESFRIAIAAGDAQGAYDGYMAVTRRVVRAAHSPAAELVLNTYIQVATAAFDSVGAMEPMFGRQIIDQGLIENFERAVAALERRESKAAERLTDAIFGLMPGTFEASAQGPGKMPPPPLASTSFKAAPA